MHKHTLKHTMLFSKRWLSYRMLLTVTINASLNRIQSERWASFCSVASLGVAAKKHFPHRDTCKTVDRTSRTANESFCYQCSISERSIWAHSLWAEPGLIGETLLHIFNVPLNQEVNPGIENIFWQMHHVNNSSSVKQVTSLHSASFCLFVCFFNLCLESHYGCQ